MAEINFPCRWCGGKYVIINDVITCTTCNPPKNEKCASVTNIKLTVEFGRKKTRISPDLYQKVQRKEMFE